MGNKKPTGIAIARDANKFTCTWKLGAKYKAQQCKVQLGDQEAIALTCGKATTSKEYSLTESSFYPASGKPKITKVTFKIQGKKGSKWYAAEQSYAVKVPKKPEVTAELVSGYTNKTQFSWKGESESNNNQYFRDIYWESVLIKDCTETKGEKAFSLTPVSGTRQTGAGTAGETDDSVVIEEDSSTLASGSFTRWFRACARGPAGNSDWVYEKHIYAKPNIAENQSVTNLTETTGGYNVTLQWDTSAPANKPIDSIVAQYVITKPDASLACPSGATWTDGNTVGYKDGTDAARITIDSKPGEDQCLFSRITTQHDGETTPGPAQLVEVGKLKAPTISSVVTNNTTHKAVVTAANASEVADAFLVVIFQGSSIPQMQVGIIPHGDTSVEVQCPDWSGETATSFGVYAVVGTPKYTTKNSVKVYDIEPISGKKLMKSDTVWSGGSVPQAPSSVTVNPTNVPGTVRVGWNWPWSAADGAEIAWADHEDAWESTDEPETYTISHLQAAQWNISGLETGITWYIRVRLFSGTGDEAVYGPWSAIKQISLSSAPNIPTLVLSERVISEDGSVTASWGYTTTDGTPQSHAEICEATITSNGITYGNIIAHATTAQHVTINAEDVGWHAGSTHNLCVRVVSGSGQVSDGWSAPVAIKVATPLTCRIASTSLKNVSVPSDDVDNTRRTVLSLTDMPMTVRIAGAGATGKTTVAIERAENYPIERPDETSFMGFEGETVALVEQTGEDEITIRKEELLGDLDDGAHYRIVATVSDELGQSDSAPLDFEVHWAHQAVTPYADVSVDQTEMVAFITPLDSADTKTWTYDDLTASEMGNLNTKLELSESTSSWDEDITYAEYEEICDLLEITYEEDQTWDCSTTINERLLLKRYLGINITFGDTCDIYRLSADRPELIFEGAELGTAYVDPYPAIGEHGGHRIVFRTVNGDYITPDNEIAWADYGAEQNDTLSVYSNIIDFDGEQLMLHYDIDLSSTWEKDFAETKYLGGAVRGDWNPAVKRSASVKSVAIVASEKETVEAMRRLATYPGICHVRTPDGSSYAANIDVSETRNVDKAHKIAEFNLTITRVDPEGFDMMTYADWIEDEQ